MAKKTKKSQRTALRTRTKAERAAIDKRAAEAKRPPRARKSMQRIPISRAGVIAHGYGYDQVVIVARKTGPGGGEHITITTYGVDKFHCDIAARIGEFFKHEAMKWPETAVSPAIPVPASDPPSSTATTEHATVGAAEPAQPKAAA